VKSIILTFTLLMTAPTLAGAVDLTLQRISPIAPVPVGRVTMSEMPPPPGVSVSPERAKPTYEIIDGRQVEVSSSRPKNIPAPSFNPTSVSFCLSDY
jgi:hypothetical protein